MLIRKICAASLMAVVSGCGGGTAIPVADYCAVASPPVLSDLAAPGEAVTVGPNGFGDASVLTVRDARIIGAEVVKYRRRCGANK